jgi:hypothetical protein
MADRAFAIRELRNGGDFYLTPMASPGGAVSQVESMPDRERLLQEFMGNEAAMAAFREAFPFFEQPEPGMAIEFEPYKPVWQNPVQREAVMQLYRNGGIQAVRERFPDDYVDDPEDMPWLSDRGYMSENLLPPGARAEMEKQRHLAYLQNLMNTERPLQYADREVWRQGGGNYMRTGQLNYAPGQARDIFPWASGGPKYPQAQEHSAAADMFMNPRAPTATAFTGIQNVIPEALSYLPESQGLLESLTRSADKVGRNLRDDSMTSMPTADVYGADHAQAVAQAGNRSQMMFDAEPDHGMEWLQGVGAPDFAINPYTGFAAEMGKSLADLSPVSTAWETAEDVAMNTALPAAMRQTTGQIARRNFVGDAAQDAMISAPMEASMPQERPQGDPQDRYFATRVAEKQMADSPRINPYRIRELLREKSAPMQRMAATNPYLQEDLANQAAEREAKRRSGPLLSVSGMLGGF